MPENFRPHLVMGIIIFILALALIIVSFIPKPPIIIQMPQGGPSGLLAPSSLQAHASDGLLAIPPLTLSEA
ncbi:MAG TPA: hypothetical protein VGN34_12350 [Ktedonobacteraceae bacterium]|jgi:hypothetical protein